MKTYGPKLKCITEKIQLNGDYNSDSATNLVVVFDLCDPEKRNDCQPKSHILDWLDEKYIITLENEKKFEENNIQKGVMHQATLRWFPMSASVRQDSVRMINRGQIELNDDIYIGVFGSDLQDIFFFGQKESRLIPYRNLWQKSITYEVSLDKYLHVRTVKSSLDVLRDLGGLSSAMVAICSAAVLVF